MLRLRTHTAIIRAAGIAALLSVMAIPAVTVASQTATAPTAVSSVQRSDFGLNVFSYDQQLANPQSITALNQIGTGMQQFPNDNTWSWSTNLIHPGDVAPVSLAKWGQVLQSTNNQGLFIFNYDENANWTGGGTPAEATQVTQYIVQNHLPINAIVIGSEEYGTWDFGANLNPSTSPAYYGQQADLIAKAIHAVDPAMLVGISFDPGQRMSDRVWNQTVLRDTAGDINFISLHDYPLTQPMSDAAMLQTLPSDIAQEMSYAKAEIASNVSPAQAKSIQIWVTEFNPYAQPTAQSTQPVYGAAIVESMIAWKAFGAARVVLWSFDGQAHSQLPGWPVASASDPNYGLFAIVGDGSAPELPLNALYPSADALSQLMQGIGSGAQLRAWIGTNLIAGELSSQSGIQGYFVNESSQPQTLSVSGQTITVPAASMVVSPLSAPISTLSPYAQASYATSGPSAVAYSQVVPVITGVPQAMYPGEVATIQGQNFGTSGFVFLNQSGVQYGAPEDAYKVQVTSWSPTAVSFVVPDGYSGPALQAGQSSVQLVAANEVVSSSADIAVQDAPNRTVLAASTPQGPPPVAANAVIAGNTVTITGQNFGTEPSLRAAPSGGFDQAVLQIHDQQNNANYGYDGNQFDWYGLQIVSWSNTQIVLQFGPTPPQPGDQLEFRFYQPGGTSPTLASQVQAIAQ